MVVRYKREVYEWFQKLDSSNRVDFICSMLKLCLPFELRLLGTCLEHLAKKDYMALRDVEQKANDARQLEDLKKDFMKSHIRSKLVINFQQYASSAPLNLRLLEDISLLLNVAVHHPAFTLAQQQELINQRENFNTLFGVHVNAEEQEQLTESQTNHSPTPFAQVSEPNYDAKGGESTTFSEAKTVTNIKPNPKSHINQTANSQQQRSSGNSQVSLDMTHTQDPVIRTLTLENTEKTKRGRLFTIKVNLVDGGFVTVKYDWNSIQDFHNKLLRRFPDDANSKKNVRQIPLLRVNTREDEIGGVVRTYLSDLCKMPVHMLQSQLVHEYFLTPVTHRPGKSPANATTPKASGLLPTPSITIVSSKLSAQNAQNPTGSHSSTSISSTSQATMNEALSPQKSPSNSNIHDNQQQSAKTPGSSSSWGPVNQKVKSPTRFSNTQVASDNANEMKSGDLYALLKANRLQKYHNLLKDLTMQQFLRLSQDEIVAMGIANGAARKLMEILERMRVNQTQGGRPNMQKFSSAQSSPSGASLSQNLHGSQPPSESSSSEHSPHTSPNTHSGKPAASKSDASDLVNKQTSRAPYSTVTKAEQREAGNSSVRPSASTAHSSQNTSFPSQNNRSQNHNPSNPNSRKTQSRTFEASSGSGLTRTVSETSIGKRDDNTVKKESPVRGNSRNNSNWRNTDRQHSGTFPKANNVRENREPVRYDAPRYSNSRENSNVRLQPSREPNTRGNARISPRDITPKQPLQHSRASPQNITFIDTNQLPPPPHNIEIQKNTAVLITNEPRLRENVPVSVEPTILVRDDGFTTRPNAVSIGAGPQSLLHTPDMESPIYMPNGPMEAVFVDPMVQQMTAGPIENQTLCGCPQCMPNWQSGWYTPGIPLPHGNMPPGGIVTSQNGYIYQSYPQPQAFVPTSNGLISPGLPPPAFRTNNPGVPPNGMIPREVMFPPQFMMPPSRHPFPPGMGPPVPGMYLPPSSGKRQCTNCGGGGHISTECPEPADTMSSSSNFQLDMHPRSDMSE